MKIIITLILSAFILTSCSNPDTSGGVTLQKSPGEPDAVSESDGGTLFKPRSCRTCTRPQREPEPDPPTSTDEFPHGDCWKPHILGDTSKKTGCGYLPGRHLYVRTYPYNNLKGANLAGARLTRANLDGANLQGANLSGAQLAFADLINANLSGADLRNVNLMDSDFSSSDVRGANFSGAYLGYAYYVGTKKDKSTVRANGRFWSGWGLRSCRY